MGAKSKHGFLNPIIPLNNYDFVNAENVLIRVIEVNVAWQEPGRQVGKRPHGVSAAIWCQST